MPRVRYYTEAFVREIRSRPPLSLHLSRLEARLGEATLEKLRDRLNYYCQIESPFRLPVEAKRIDEIEWSKSPSYYFLDFMEYARFFPNDSRFDYLFKDVMHVPDHPTIVKSRPIGDNVNSVLFKLNKLRHFHFVKDRKRFREKNERLIWRGAAKQEHRKAFLEKFHGKSRRIDVAHYGREKSKNPEWQGTYTSIAEQLKFSFILSIEGRDVATNTKWVMSSNSLLMMTKPKYETWFMEGRLVAGKHYVQLADDYSDLEEKMDHFLAHPGEAEEIIEGAHCYVSQFLQRDSEDWLSLKVLEKYLSLTISSDA